MAFIVETGQGLENATSYVSVEFADSYFEQFGNSDWGDLEENQKQLALNKATRSIDVMYGQRYQSYPSFPDTQSLLFPRSAFYINTHQLVSSTSIPRILKEAVCELAVQIALNDEFTMYPDVNATGLIKSQKMKLEGLELDVVYDGATTNEQYNGFYAVQILLGPLLQNGGDVAGTYYEYLSL